MKKSIILLLTILIMAGCTKSEEKTDITATTLPVYEFTQLMCDGTGLTVSRLITQSVSCLHDYSLNVRQVKTAESSKLIVLSGAGLEDFMEDIIYNHPCIDASEGIALLTVCEDGALESDPHIWLSPKNARIMIENVYEGLCREFPENRTAFTNNYNTLCKKIEQLSEYGASAMNGLCGKPIITFHDGFAYLADEYGLVIAETIEEEAGSEASAKDIISLIRAVEDHNITALFTEKEGSPSAASIISAETGIKVYALDMAMSGQSYFEAMYYNFDTLKEALS